MVVSARFARSVLLFFFLSMALIHLYASRMILNPHYGRAFFKVGMECRNKCTLNKQLSYFQKAVFYDPNLNEAYHQMGIICGQEGRDEEEFMSYQKAAVLDHRNTDAYFKVGIYYFRKGDWERALRYFLQSDRYNSRDDGVYYMAEIYEKKGAYQDAVSQYIKLIRRNSFFSVKACERIRDISKIPDQKAIVLDHVYQSLHLNPDLRQQMDRYLRTGRIPEFLDKVGDGVGHAVTHD